MKFLMQPISRYMDLCFFRRCCFHILALSFADLEDGFVARFRSSLLEEVGKSLVRPGRLGVAIYRRGEEGRPWTRGLGSGAAVRIRPHSGDDNDHRTARDHDEGVRMSDSGAQGRRGRGEAEEEAERH